MRAVKIASLAAILLVISCFSPVLAQSQNGSSSINFSAEASGECLIYPKSNDLSYQYIGSGSIAISGKSTSSIGSNSQPIIHNSGVQLQGALQIEFNGQKANVTFNAENTKGWFHLGSVEWGPNHFIVGATGLDNSVATGETGVTFEAAYSNATYSGTMSGYAEVVATKFTGDNDAIAVFFFDSTGNQINSVMWSRTDVQVNPEGSILKAASSFDRSMEITATSTASSKSGVIIVDHNSVSGVNVIVTDTSLPDNTNVEVSTIRYGIQPPKNMGVFSVEGLFYDVQVKDTSRIFSPNATVRVSITDLAISNKTISYWNGANWIPVETIDYNNNTIVGVFTVSQLQGTPVVVSTIPELTHYVFAALICALTLIAIALQVYKKKSGSPIHKQKQHTAARS